MKRIVITGASSFIGKRLVLATINRGWDVVAVVRRNCQKLQDFPLVSNLTFVELNMCEYDRIGKVVGNTDCFIHLAWNGTRGEDRVNEELQFSNYQNSVSAIESMLQAGCKCVLTAGSQAEYGVCNQIIDEAMECKPNTAYGKYKLRLYNEALELCRNYEAAYKEPRFFSLYGPGDYEKTLIMSLVDNLKNHRECKLTECVQMWDFVYVDDAIEAVLLLCEKECEDGAYNIASGDIRILREYVEEIYRVLKSKSQLVYGAVPYPTSGMVSIQPSIEKIKRETGWIPKMSFKDGILKLVSETD